MPCFCCGILVLMVYLYLFHKCSLALADRLILVLKNLLDVENRYPIIYLLFIFAKGAFPRGSCLYLVPCRRACRHPSRHNILIRSLAASVVVDTRYCLVNRDLWGSIIMPPGYWKNGERSNTRHINSWQHIRYQQHGRAKGKAAYDHPRREQK